jgi:hypothetical protein
MAQQGHRIAHLAEMGLDEAATDPIVVPMSGASGARTPGIAVRPTALSFSRERRERLRASAPQPAFGLPIYDLAAVGVVIAGAAMASIALLLF